jgi:hypothetical protein
MQRRENETFTEYRDRLKAEQATEKTRGRGVTTLWNSPAQGTYTLQGNGPLGVIRLTGSEKRIARRVAEIEAAAA